MQSSFFSKFILLDFIAKLLHVVDPETQNHKYSLRQNNCNIRFMLSLETAIFERNSLPAT